ncbi:MAG: TVP38/TMEM64 family protein [Burkholderiales bacterium]
MFWRDTLASFLEWVQGIGPWGAVLFAGAYVPAAVLLVPGSLLTLGAGFLFGVVKGTVVVSLGSTAGAAAAFLVGRSIAREWVARRLAGRPKMASIARAVETEGFKIVLLTRLSPVLPFNLLNYAFGLTAVPFRKYILASWIGMLPGTIMYVYLGSAANSLAALLSGDEPRSTGQQVLFVLGLAATVAATIIVTRTARRALNAIVPP